MAPTDLASLAAAVDLTEGDIADAAERLAGKVRTLARTWHAAGTADDQRSQALAKLARRHHVAQPGKASFAQRLARMQDPAWWRRALRKRLRIVELQAIRAGQVHAHGSPYASAKALYRAERNAKRVAAQLASLDAVNLDTGEVLPLKDVVERSQANPANRRAALMVRIKGIEAQAQTKGHLAVFLTLTAPSRMHARHHTGQANDRYDGTSPRDAQAYLNGVWRCAMRELQRRGLHAYGLRTVEPHHDGCPHWHVLLWAAPGAMDAALAVLRRHALADSPSEPGAQARRLKVEAIDPAKGSAAAYVAKYVSKSIDGHGVDTDDESAGTGADSARRIVAWARLWGIRQFQFFGLPPITPARELRRQALKGATFDSAGLTAAHAAAWANDYAAYLAALETHGVAFSLRYDLLPSRRYAGELARVVRGLNARAADIPAALELITRTECWVIQPRAAGLDLWRADGALGTADVFPWTRFNNCANPGASGTYDIHEAHRQGVRQVDAKCAADPLTDTVGAPA